MEEEKRYSLVRLSQQYNSHANYSREIVHITCSTIYVSKQKLFLSTVSLASVSHAADISSISRFFLILSSSNPIFFLDVYLISEIRFAFNNIVNVN